MPRKGNKPTKKKQRHYVLDYIDKIAAAAFWFVKIVLLLIEWFTR